MSIKSTVVTDNRINANVSPPTKIVPKNVLIPDVSKELIGLGNVDNTADIDKPISTLVQAALDLKANQSTTYTKTEVDAKLTASGNDASSDLTAHVNSTNNPHGVDKIQVGLSNVDNESKATMFTDAVFTGDLTADTTTLKVDSTNHRVGIGTNPSNKLHVKSPGTIAQNPENFPHATIRVENTGNNLYIDGNEVVSTGSLHLQTVKHIGFISLAADDSAGTRVNIANASATGFAIGKGTGAATRPLDVTGDAIFRGKGTFGVNGDVTDAEAQPSIVLFKPKAAASIRQTRLTIGTNNDEAAFEIQTFDANNTFISNDYRIEKNANGADKHEFSIGNSPKLEITSDGMGINKTPGRTFDMDGHFRLEVTRPNRTTESVAVIKSNDQTAADLRVDGPIRVTHDLFKESGVTGGFADNSNHFHTIQTINRITQQGAGEVKNIERVQEQYYAIQSNNLKNSKAAFWNWHRVSRSIDISAVSLTNLEGWNVSAIQDSSNRQATSQVFFKDSENTIFTFNSQVNREAVLSNGDLLQVNIDIDFEGAIVAASLFAKVTGVSGATANVKLFGGNYKSTNEVPDGNSQTALTTNFSVNKINTGSYMALHSKEPAVSALLDSTRTTTTDTFSLTFASNHNLELNDTITLITDSTNGFKPAEVAFVKEKTSNTEAKFVYGRVFEPASNLVLGNLSHSSVIGVLKGSIDPLHDFTAGDQLMHFNADNAGRYKSYQIGPGSEVGADCISIGKNVYNKDASTIKIGYDNNMLNIHSTGIDVAGKIKTTGIINGSTHATAQPITYDAKEHRFRDFDTIPNNLMVIKKTDGVPIGKVGINHNNPVSALHVVGGHTSSGVGAPNEALRVVGSGLFTSVDDIALIVARDTNNNDSHSSGNDLGGHVLKIKQDVSTSNTAAMEEMNIGFVGSGGDGIYANSQSNAAYLQVANEKNFEIATGSTPTRRLSINGTSGTVVVDGSLSVGSSATVGGDLKVNDKIIHNGDTDTAIRFPGNNIFTVETAGVERLRVNSTGEVGIGKTAAAGVELDVNGDIAATDITASGNVAITGNLTISGTTTTINTTNLDITDNIIGLNNGLTGTNLNDSGIIIERGTSGANAAIIWDESGGKFVLGTTATATADSTGNIIVTEGDLKINDLEASGNITTNGNITLTAGANSQLVLQSDTIIDFDGDLSIGGDGLISFGGTDIFSAEDRHLLQPDGFTALSWSNSGVSISSLSVTNMLSSVGDIEADGAEFGMSGGSVEFGGQVTFSEAVEFQDEADFTSGSLVGLSGLALGSGGLTVDTNVLAVNGTSNKVGVNTTPIGSSATFTVNGSVLVQDGSEKSLDLQHTDSYVYKIGDIDGGETGAYLEINSVDEYARLHTNLGINKDPGSGKALDVSGNALIDNLEVYGTMLASGDCEVQTTLELTQNSGINATGDIETTGIVKAKGFALDTNTFTVVSTTSTLASSTNGLTVILQNTGPITITLPTLTAGHVTTFIAETINPVTFIGDTGVTVNSFAGNDTTAGQFAQCQVIYKTSTVAFLGGNLV